MLGLNKKLKMEERGLSSSLHGLDFLSSGVFSSSPTTTKFSSPTTTSTFCSFHHQHPAAARYHLSQSLQL